MNENKDGATDKTNDSSTITKGKAVHSFMTPKKQVIEEVPKDTNMLNETSSQNESETKELEETVPIPNVSTLSVSDNRQKEANRKKRFAGNYSELFLGRYELNSRQGLHVEKETIATIKRIVHGIGDPRLTVSGFVENVLKHHFEIYKEEINRLFDEKIRKPIL